MRKNYRIFSVIALYTVCILLYVFFFIFRIENTPLFLALTIGSVAVLSTSTIYTIIQSKSSQQKIIKEKKYPIKIKSVHKEDIDIVEDYIDAMPSIEDYIESDVSYKDMPILDKYIFSSFSREELLKIDLLELSKMDKILFIREMCYFSPNERKQLIENMLNSRNETEEKLTYTPPINPIEIEDKIRIYVRSLVEPGEKTKIIIVDTFELISIIKERIATKFDYKLEDFLLSSGGILLDENSIINDYDIIDDDEIALIPLRKVRN
ncbi:MAG: hypothetical protein JSV62_03230 [Promethearchaeota archaeon]|nr:MAG: hypothetical protein JSV62_03230 [Candidatus Lokiarchaeota archaeon]